MQHDSITVRISNIIDYNLYFAIVVPQKQETLIQNRPQVTVSHHHLLRHHHAPLYTYRCYRCLYLCQHELTVLALDITFVFLSALNSLWREIQIPSVYLNSESFKQLNTNNPIYSILS